MTLTFITIGTLGFIAIVVRFFTRHTQKETSPVSIK